MKCKTCQTIVPPVFAQALLDNSCPACGKEILGQQGFREMMQMRKQLSSLELESRMATTIAAALSEKFDLVPKGSRNQDGYGELTGLAEATEAATDEPPVDEERQLRERALREAKKQRNQQIVSEWGMDKGQFINKKGQKVASSTEVEEFDESYEDDEPLDLDVPPPPFMGSGGTKAAERAARLAAAEQARNSGAFMVRRRDDR